ncbi:MAG TPA: shikimate kinase [bacterium]
MNVVLIGFMASGKTSVGKRLSRRLGYRFVDTDQFIEEELGCTIAELFITKGEPFFREMETRVSRRLSKLDNAVVSTGGGLPITQGNLELLKVAGPVVFLKASLDDILQRLERDTRRPKLKEGENLRDTVMRLLEQRLPRYEQADFVVETAQKGMNRVAGEIIRLVSGFRRPDEPSQAAASDTPANPPTQP